MSCSVAPIDCHKCETLVPKMLLLVISMHALVACVLTKMPLAWENGGWGHEIPVVMLWCLGC